MSNQPLGNNLCNRLTRAQTSKRILKYNLHALAETAHLFAAKMRDVFTLKTDRATGRIEQAQDQATHG